MGKIQKQIQLFLRTYSLSILTGFFIGTSYIPFPPWAQFFCFVPLWLAWQQSSTYKSIFWQGWVAQWVLTFIGFNWVAFTVHEFGGMPWTISILVLFLFCAIANLYVPLAGIVWFYLQKKFPTSAKMNVLRLALITAFFESWLPTLFPWNYGYPWLWINWPVAQLGELIGFQGLSTIMIMLNVGFFWTVKYSLAHLKNISVLLVRPHIVGLRPAILSLFLFLLMNLLGWGLLRSSPVPDQNLSLIITQANIGNQMKMAAERGMNFREHIMGRYIELTRAEVEKNPADLILWPETAIPYTFDFDSYFSPPIMSLIDQAREWQSVLLTGGYGYSDQVEQVTNSLFVIEPDAGIQRKHYFKTILLAFGEYIPFGDVFPNLYEYIPAGHFRKGHGPMVVSVQLKKNGEQVNLGPQICYESLFPDFSRALANKGAEIIVNVTNDSWYGTWQEPYQHLYMTAARALEFRRPLLRSTNTGISAVVLATGEVVNPSPMNTEWTGHYTVPYKKNPRRTFYQMWPWLMDFLILSSLAVSLRTRHKGSMP